MSLCPECGRLMPDNASVCDSCGHDFVKEIKNSELRKATEELDRKFGKSNPIRTIPDENLKVSRAISYIWRYPRSTIRFLCNKNAIKSAYMFGALASITHNFNQLLKHGIEASTSMSKLSIIMTNIGFGALLGFLIILLSGVILNLVGSWFGSKAMASECRICLGWSYVPYVPSLIVVLLLVILAPYGFSISNILNPNELPASASGLFRTLALLYNLGLRGIMGIWSVVILVAGFSEITGFSIIKSIGVLILAALIGVIPIGTMVYLYSSLVL